MLGLDLEKVDLRSIWGHQYWEVAVELTKNYAVNKSLEKKATLRYVRSFASKQNHNHGCFAKPDQFNNTIHSGSIRNQWQPYWKNLSKICHQTLQFSSIILCIRSCICSTSGMYIKYGFLDIFKNHWFFFQILMWTSRNFLDDAFYLTFFTIFFGAAGGVGLLAVHRPSYCT